jgi:hypothetical protein
MKAFTYLSWSFLLLLLGLGSCVEEIDLPNTRRGGELVIHGTLTPSRSPQKLRIARTSPEERITVPVTGASARVFDEQGNWEFYREVGEGVYEFMGNQIQVEKGHSYYLEVNILGRIYRSRPERMPTEVGYDELEWIATPQKFVEVYADSYFPATEDPLFIRWNVEEVYILEPTDFPDPFNDIPPPCYIWEYPNQQRMSLYNGALNPTERLPQTLVARQYVDYRFLSRHYFLVTQLSISREAFEYWERVNKAVNRTGSIFDAPPAPVAGNLFSPSNPNEQVLGYFEVALTDTASIFTVPGFFNFWIPPYCRYVPFQPVARYPRVCINCLDFPNSSLQKPDFF